jgi:hypothetical protein
MESPIAPAYNSVSVKGIFRNQVDEVSHRNLSRVLPKFQAHQKSSMVAERLKFPLPHNMSGEMQTPGSQWAQGNTAIWIKRPSGML